MPGPGPVNTVWLGGSNTFTATILNSNTVLSIGSDAGAPFTINGGTLQLRGSGVTNLNLTPAIASSVAFDVNFAGNTFTIATNLTVAGSLTKLGTGMMVLERQQQHRRHGNSVRRRRECPKC